MSVLEYIRQEFAVIKAAPPSCLFIVAIGFGIGGLFYGARLDLAHESNENYRRSLGTSAPYSGVYADLSNNDLKAKTARMVKNLRTLQFQYQHRSTDIHVQLQNHEIDQAKFNVLSEAFNQQISEEFTKNFKSEAVALDNELRHRLSPEALKTIVGSPAFDPPITIVSLLPSGMLGGKIGIFGVEISAGELEQMNAKLPYDKRRWWIFPCVLIGISLFIISIFGIIYSGFRIVRIRDQQSQPASLA